jgi:hypothetical protein
MPGRGSSEPPLPAQTSGEAVVGVLGRARWSRELPVGALRAVRGCSPLNLQLVGNLTSVWAASSRAAPFATEQRTALVAGVNGMASRGTVDCWGARWWKPAPRAPPASESPATIGIGDSRRLGDPELRRGWAVA